MMDLIAIQYQFRMHDEASIINGFLIPFVFELIITLLYKKEAAEKSIKKKLHLRKYSL